MNIENTGIRTVCQCGESIYILRDSESEPGFYRVPEVVSPVIDGKAGERSFTWLDRVHAYRREAQSE